MAIVRKNDQIRHVEGRLGFHQPQTCDIIRREDFQPGEKGDVEYVDACAKRDLDGEDPRLAELRRKYFNRLEQQREAERQRREAQIFAEAREKRKRK